MNVRKEKKQHLLNSEKEKKKSNVSYTNLMEIRKNIGNNMMEKFLDQLDGSTDDIRQTFTNKLEVMKEYEPDKREQHKKGTLEKISHLSMDVGDISIGKFRENDDIVLVPHMKNTMFRTASFEDMKRVKGGSARTSNFHGVKYRSNPNGMKKSATAIMTENKKQPSRLIKNIEKALQNEDIRDQNQLLEDIFPFLSTEKEREMINDLKKEKKQVVSIQKRQNNHESIKEKSELQEYKTYIDTQIKKLKEIIERKKRRKRKLLTRFLSIQLKIRRMKKSSLDSEQDRFHDAAEQSIEDDFDDLKDSNVQEQEEFM